MAGGRGSKKARTYSLDDETIEPSPPVKVAQSADLVRVSSAPGTGSRLRRRTYLHADVETRSDASVPEVDDEDLQPRLPNAQDYDHDYYAAIDGTGHSLRDFDDDLDGAPSDIDDDEREGLNEEDMQKTAEQVAQEKIERAEAKVMYQCSRFNS
jgi:hypothetical protein